VDYSKLKPKVDELVAAHPDWTDRQIADGLNAATVPELAAIPSSELLAWSAADDRFYRTETAAASGPKPVRSIAKVALLLITRPDTELDLTLLDRAGFVDTLVASEVWTEADKVSLYELATRAIPYPVSIGRPDGRLDATHIAKARAM
jgi:hypothetical protein